MLGADPGRARSGGGGSVRTDAWVSDAEPTDSDTDHSTPPSACRDELGGAPADVDDGDAARPAVAQHPRRAQEREPRLVLAARAPGPPPRSPRGPPRTARRRWRRRGSPPSPPRGRARPPSRGRAAACAATVRGELGHLLGRDRAAVPRKPGEHALGDDLAAAAAPSGSATSRRVVFDPMSMQAQRTRVATIRRRERRPRHPRARPAQGLRRPRGRPRDRLRGRAAARSSGCWGPTARARRRPSRSSRATASARAASSRVLGHDPGQRSRRAARSASASSCRAAGMYRHITVREAVAHWALPVPAPARRRRGHRAGRPARARRRAQIRTLSGGQAAARRLRARARRRPGADLPRRADDRLRPRRPPRGVGRHPPARRARQDRPADDALPRRGPGARRPRRDHQGRARSSPRARRASSAAGAATLHASPGATRTASCRSARPRTRPRCCTS